MTNLQRISPTASVGELADCINSTLTQLTTENKYLRMDHTRSLEIERELERTKLDIHRLRQDANAEIERLQARLQADESRLQQVFESVRKCMVYATGSIEAAERIMSIVRTGDVTDVDFEALVKDTA